MASISRSGLKQLVRELLREVLLEALGDPRVVALPEETVQESRKRASSAQPGPRRAPGFFDRNLDRRVAAVAGNSGLMADILSQTAARTLPQMEAADRSLGLVEADQQTSPGISQVEQINGSPESVFGEDVASHWAAVAFADVKKPG